MAPAESAKKTPIHPARRSSEDGCIVSGSSIDDEGTGADEGPAGSGAFVSLNQSGYSSLRQARGSSEPALGVRSSRNEWYGATKRSGAITV